MTDNTVYILDSYALIYRSYYAFINRPLTNEKNENVSAVFGFFRNLLNLLQSQRPSFAAAAFDSRTPTFRHQMYDQYKANRDKTPEDLHAQVPVIENILQALGIPVLRQDGFEADDIIATVARMCREQNKQCRILSGDKDLMQLIDDKIMMMKNGKTGGWELIGSEQVEQEWGVPPSLMLDMLSLTGDTADNITGVPGIGQKTAQKLLAQYGSFEGIYEHAGEITGALGNKIREGKTSGEFSRTLIRLKTDVPLGTTIEDLSLAHIDYAAASHLLQNCGVFAVAKQYAQAAESAQGQKKEVSSAKPSDSSATPSAAIHAAKTPHTDIPEEKTADEVRQNTGDYRPVYDLTQLTALIDTVLELKTAAFDCETDSLNAHQARLAGFSLCTQAGTAYYVPIETTDMLLAGNLIAKKDALHQLERIFYNKDIHLIMHNGKYDLEVLLANGLGSGKFPECTVYDTMIAAWLLQPERDSFKLGSLAESKLGLKGIEFADIVPKGATFMDVPPEQAVPYAAEDADFTLQLWHVLKKQLESTGLSALFYELETPVLPVLAQMEIAGIGIEKQKLTEYSAELTAQIKTAEQTIYDTVGHEFNIASTKQLQQVLFEELKLTPSKKTKTGFSTDTGVLEELALWHSVPKQILEYRALAKLKSTYVDALPALADKNGRIHTSFIQTGTATGRLSSRDPNLQNIPVREEAGRRIRAAFSAPKGRVLVSADYAQIELVILAHLSQDKNLCAAFNEGTDVHRSTAALIFGVPPEQITAEQRRTAKTINFGVMYGMSAFRLSNELGIPMGTAKQFIDSYFATYSGVKEFIYKTIADAEQNGYVQTIMGRRRIITSINSANKKEKAAAERIAVNTPIQGSAADIVKKAMIAVDRALKKNIAGARLLLQVHDELIAECSEEQAKDTVFLLKTEMEKAVELSVPLRVSVEYGANWGEFH